MTSLFVIPHAIILVALLLTSNDPQILRNINQEKNCINLEAGQKGFIQLAKVDEPGEPLIIYGKVLDRKANQPIRDASLFLYQTDSSGIYSASGNAEEQARIQGTIQTNESGCFKIMSILPGDYPGRKNSRHLHYVINANGYQQLKSILLFKGFTSSNSSSQESLPVLDIKKENNGSWIGTIDITMEPTDTTHP